MFTLTFVLTYAYLYFSKLIEMNTHPESDYRDFNVQIVYSSLFFMVNCGMFVILYLFIYAESLPIGFAHVFSQGALIMISVLSKSLGKLAIPNSRSFRERQSYLFLRISGVVLGVLLGYLLTQFNDNFVSFSDYSAFLFSLVMGYLVLFIASDFCFYKTKNEKYFDYLVIMSIVFFGILSVIVLPE